MGYTFVGSVGIIPDRLGLDELLIHNASGGSFGRPCRVMLAVVMVMQNRLAGLITRRWNG